MRKAVDDFFRWYERHYTVNVAVAAGLFVLQLVHLYWLSTSVIAERLVEESYFSPSGIVYYTILVIDYTEIPVLFSVSLIYINELRKGFSWKPILFLVFLNSQWLHIFWITDEFVVTAFEGGPSTTSLPDWLAWMAILIDYLEVPVIYDTLRRLATSVRTQRVGQFLRQDLAD